MALEQWMYAASQIIPKANNRSNPFIGHALPPFPPQNAGLVGKYQMARLGRHYVKVVAVTPDKKYWTA